MMTISHQKDTDRHLEVTGKEWEWEWEEDRDSISKSIKIQWFGILQRSHHFQCKGKQQLSEIDKDTITIGSLSIKDLLLYLSNLQDEAEEEWINYRQQLEMEVEDRELKEVNETMINLG